jgi:hypothetical protein
MAITDYATYKADAVAPYNSLSWSKDSLATIAGRLSSLWLTAPFAGAAPTTAAVPTSATTGAWRQLNSSGVQRIASIEASCAQGGYLIIADRLSHQGGLSGTVITAQTTNLGTAALTRYTSGIGVMAGLEIYSAVGTTGTTVTASYTNTTPTSGRTSIATTFGGTGFREAGRMILLPLQQGDDGVTAVASVTVLASTVTAGNFGVTLFKPLLAIPIPFNPGQQFVYDAVLNMSTLMPQVVNNACLFTLFVANTSASGVFQGVVNFIEE